MNEEELSMSSKRAGPILIVLGILGLIITLSTLSEQKNYLILSSIVILIGFILTAIPQKQAPSVQASMTVSPEPPPAAPPKPKEQIRKACPTCNEKIILEARRCRFCGEIFDPDTLKKQIETGRAQLS
jgi:hypothetical protein